MSMPYRFWPVLLLFGSAGYAAAAAPRYNLTLLDSVQGTAVAINNAGQIIGNRYDPLGGPRTFSWRDGQMQLLPQSFAGVWGISGQGHIAGVSNLYMDDGGTQSETVALMYYQDTKTVMPESFRPNTSARRWHSYSRAMGVNSSGTVIVQSETNARSGAFSSLDGVNTILPMDVPTAINDAGQIVGSRYGNGGAPHAVLYDNGQLTDLGTLPTEGFAHSGAAGLNDFGAVVGNSIYGYGAQRRTHSFLYQNGQMVALGELTVNNHATDINNAGTVIGGFRSADFSEHAYLYQDGVQYDLDTLLDGVPGWRINLAEDINDSGQIVGQACNQAGACFAALLSPVPEPGTYAMLLAGLSLVGWRRYAKRGNGLPR